MTGFADGLPSPSIMPVSQAFACLSHSKSSALIRLHNLQISQLLASINGEKSSTPSALPPARLPKRKADDDASASGSKLQRTATPTSSSTGSVRPTAEPPKTLRPAERSSTGYAGSARPSSTPTARPITEKYAASASKKPTLVSNGKSSPTSASFASASKSGSYSTNFPTKRPTGTPAPSAATTQSANSDSAKAPKKGSIAEIRARAAAQQEKLQAIGKIQHKATEKPLTKKEREEAAAEELRLQKKGLKFGVKTGTGLVSKNGSNGLQRSGNGHVDRERGAVQKASTSSRPGKSALGEEPKRKKAAVATTGYTGSARPVAGKAKPGVSKPGPSNRVRDQDRDRRPNPMGMFSKPRRRHEDDYDEEMDDFVVDDEEEEEEGYGNGSRYRYADEDDDSDMEAGFSDVEDEEAAATRMAILDDKREQQLEEQHRREKEARKRKLFAGRR